MLQSRTILKPLRNRVPTAPVADPAVVVPERRRQRAEAIGSVLSSLVTAFVFSIALRLNEKILESRNRPSK